MDLDTWKDNFQKADPNKYRQFKNKTPEKKDVKASLDIAPLYNPHLGQGFSLKFNF